MRSPRVKAASLGDPWNEDAMGQGDIIKEFLMKRLRWDEAASLEKSHRKRLQGDEATPLEEDRGKRLRNDETAILEAAHVKMLLMDEATYSI
jgi:hypothetical protein